LEEGQQSLLVGRYQALAASLHAGLLPAGVTQLRWDGRAGDGQPVGAGVYFVRAFAGGKLDTRKLVLLP